MPTASCASFQTSPQSERNKLRSKMRDPYGTVENNTAIGVVKKTGRSTSIISSVSIISVIVRFLEGKLSAKYDINPSNPSKLKRVEQWVWPRTAKMRHVNRDSINEDQTHQGGDFVWFSLVSHAHFSILKIPHHFTQKMVFFGFPAGRQKRLIVNTASPLQLVD